MRENKQEILDLLLPTLQATNNLHDLVSLELKEGSHSEVVIATFANGHKKQVNTHMDSGTEMIGDIMRHIL